MYLVYSNIASLKESFLPKEDTYQSREKRLQISLFEKQIDKKCLY